MEITKSFFTVYRQKGNFCGNHLSLFAAVTRDLGRRGYSGRKMGHVTKISKQVHNTSITGCSRLRIEEPYSLHPPEE
jgi:hypothetical protein